MAAAASEAAVSRDSDASDEGPIDLDGVMKDLAELAPDSEEVDLTGSLDQIAAASALGARMKGCPDELHLNDDDHFVLHEGNLTKIGKTVVPLGVLFWTAYSWRVLAAPTQAAALRSISQPRFIFQRNAATPLLRRHRINVQKLERTLLYCNK